MTSIPSIKRRHLPGLLRTGLQIRRTGDVRLGLRYLRRRNDSATGFVARGQRVILLFDPALTGELFVREAPRTVKGPGVKLTKRLLGEGLLTSEGDTHTRARRLVAPAFSRRRLTGYVDTFAERATACAEGWDDGEVVDMHEAMATLTLDAVGRTLLSVDLTDDADSGRDGSAAGVREALESALREFTRAGSGLVGRGRAAALPTGYGPERAAVDRLVDGIVAERRLHPSEDRGDVISALIAASAGPDGLTDTEINDHVITLLMAGHETTANALTWTIYLLGQHPSVRERLFAEVAALGHAPSFDDLPALAFTRAVMTEGMRMYPPAWIIGRTVLEPFDLGRWHVPAETLVAFSPLVSHHDARWFPSPETFDPERWLDARRDDVPKYAYLPFGTGPRACIGEQFAWAEAITILATLAQQWDFSTVAPGEVKPHYAVTMRPSGPVRVRVTRRPRAESGV